MTKEELKNQIIELKENCKKLAEDYREKYNQDNENKIALNMFYHNVISYNDYESVLALIENRNSMIMCFSAPPVLTEETVEINLKRIADLEHQLTHRNCLDCSNHSSKLRMRTLKLEKENTELKKQLEMRNKVYNNNLDYSHHIEDQLTKAKEIIREFVEWANWQGSNCPNFKSIQDKAEQFLSEVEE